jgi:hypothetical protein
MVVERWVIHVKPGHIDEVVAMLQAEREKLDDPNRVRIYVSQFGDMSRVSYEFEHESLAALEQNWNDWFARPDTPQFMERWNTHLASGDTRSVWTLAE